MTPRDRVTVQAAAATSGRAPRGPAADRIWPFVQGSGVDASRRAVHSRSMDRDRGRVRRPRCVAAGAPLIVMLLLPAGARADVAPTVTQRPIIAGVPRDSETLTASA